MQNNTPFVTRTFAYPMANVIISLKNNATSFEQLLEKLRYDNMWGKKSLDFEFEKYFNWFLGKLDKGLSCKEIALAASAIPFENREYYEQNKTLVDFMIRAAIYFEPWLEITKKASPEPAE